jgi:HAMP domain-containing protein
MQLTSIEFQFNSLFTQIQNLGFIQNTYIQINSISFQILNFGVQMLNLCVQVDDNITINNYSTKEQINGIITQLKNISNNIIKNNVNQTINDTNKNENEELKNEINELKNEIKSLKEQQNKIQNKFEDSNIINANYYNIISDWISPNKKIEVNLLYRASRDGDKAKDFHDKCDNKGSTFCIFQLDNGYIIGGYSSISWKDNGEGVKDPNAFVCSITNRKKYELRNKNGNAVYHGNFHGPDFYGGSGAADIYIYDNCLHINGGILICNNTYNSSMKELTGKDSQMQFHHKLKDYEVYQVL